MPQAAASKPAPIVAPDCEPPPLQIQTFRIIQIALFLGRIPERKNGFPVWNPPAAEVTLRPCQSRQNQKSQKACWIGDSPPRLCAKILPQVRLRDSERSAFDGTVLIS